MAIRSDNELYPRLHAHALDEHSTKSVEESRSHCLYFAFSLEGIIELIEKENPLF